MSKLSPIQRSLESQPPEFSQATQRVALVVQYVGTDLHGWQWQPNARTVQGEIEAAIQAVLGYAVRLHGAGRTDTGVHAAAQVAHFDAPDFIPAHRWAEILNARLPQDVLIRASAQVADTWHAQFSAQWRRYRYTLYTDPRPNLFVRPLVWHYYHRYLDQGKMQAALDTMVGYHDMTAFHRARSGKRHSWVDLQGAECHRRDAFLTVELQAKGFLYGMVRLVMGLLVQVGSGDISPADFQTLWQQRQRQRVKYSAPAQGLCLLRVGYDPMPFDREVWFDTQPHFYLGPAVA
ncbi:tRNA pseudouridine(38-40) synthase TruA [Nodosilinea sp. P-1105]|uniref:tRNA pseudouridine(38-40) synthase TruA n=1 Tax=Nodosilinea sp. P-1105 TaxID=2546229 RepID=UPI001469E356|nr:tRNA pseudouridine(38-40) synthase TruA [Nodosilinea sp. P-1105]NMF82233.1 tRNA pseudouridine(38-40) synthase TruA [Nodosilinea sp. P-1105]